MSKDRRDMATTTNIRNVNKWWRDKQRSSSVDLDRALSSEFPFLFTVGQNNQESRLKYWATHSFVRSFTRTAHSFACLAQLASFTRSAHSLAPLTCLLAHSLACSLHSLPHSWEVMSLRPSTRLSVRWSVGPYVPCSF